MATSPNPEGLSMKRFAMAVLLLPLGVAATAEGKKPKNQTADVAASTIAPELASLPPSVGTEPRHVDLNNDGKPDLVQWVDGGGRVEREQCDLNFDGRLDTTTYYDGSGNIVREEFDGDFDGRIDWVDTWQGGQRVKAEADTNYDGRVDLVKTYSGGDVVKLERDADGDGVVDP